MARTVWICAALVATMLPVPSATAFPYASFTIYVNAEGSDVELDEEGRGTAYANAFLTFRDLRCAATTTVWAHVDLREFPKWAGASLGTPRVGWTIRALSSEADANPTRIRLDIAWDVDAAPKKWNRQEYVVRVQQVVVEGPCLLTPATISNHPGVLAAHWQPPEPRPDPSPGPDPVHAPAPLAPEPHPHHHVGVAERDVGGSVSSAPIALVLLAIVAMASCMRRR